MKTNHTFALCAYKESEHLEECLISLLNQTVKTNIIITTSTPNNYIYGIAKKYDIKVYETGKKSDIQDDWNFAYNSSETDFVTIAHQDDIYHKDYVKYMLQAFNKKEDTIIFISDYLPIKSGKIGKRDINSKLRRFLRSPLKISFLANKKFVKKRCLAFGNCICAPSVTYNKKVLGENVFKSKLKFCLDWDTFLRLSAKNGSFSYTDKPLICYRVYDGATTKAFIENHEREVEDLHMLKKFWPKPIAKFIMVFYVKAYETYR